MEHIIICENKEEFLHVADMTEVEVSKKALFAKGDVLYVCFMHLSASFDVISVLPNCIDDELVHLCLVPVLVEGEVKKYAAHN